MKIFVGSLTIVTVGFVVYAILDIINDPMLALSVMGLAALVALFTAFSWCVGDVVYRIARREK
jgi:hypothetical protein